MIEGDFHKLTFYWKSIDEVKDLIFYPLFIKDRIANLPQLLEHIVEIKSSTFKFVLFCKRKEMLF